MCLSGRELGRERRKEWRLVLGWKSNLSLLMNVREFGLLPVCFLSVVSFLTFGRLLLVGRTSHRSP